MCSRARSVQLEYSSSSNKIKMVASFVPGNITNVESSLLDFAKEKPSTDDKRPWRAIFLSSLIACIMFMLLTLNYIINLIVELSQKEQFWISMDKAMSDFSNCKNKSNVTQH